MTERLDAPRLASPPSGRSTAAAPSSPGASQRHRRGHRGRARRAGADVAGIAPARRRRAPRRSRPRSRRAARRARRARRRRRRPGGGRARWPTRRVAELGGIDVWVNNAARMMVKPVHRDDRRGLARPARRQPARLLLRLPRGRARDDRAGRAAGGSSTSSAARILAVGELSALHRRQGRDRGADEGARGRARPARHHGQRDRAGRRSTRR